GDEVGHDVEQRRFSRTGTTGDDDVQSSVDTRSQKVGDFWSDGTEADEIVDAQLFSGEFSDGDRRADQRDGWDDDVHARAVGQAGIDDRRRLVDVATEW